MAHHLSADITMLLQTLCGHLRTQLGDNLLAVYLTGSAAYGAFLPGISDLDGIILLREDWHLRSPRGFRPNDLLFDATHPLNFTFTTLRAIAEYPLIDLVGLHRHGQLLAGEDVRAQIGVPTLDAVRLDLMIQLLQRYYSPRGIELPYRCDPRYFAQYLANGARVARWIVYPARTLYSWHTGAIASKADAADWFADRYPGPIGAWIWEAMAWRCAGFPDREATVRRWGGMIPWLTGCLAHHLRVLLISGAHAEPQAASATLSGAVPTHVSADEETDTILPDAAVMDQLADALSMPVRAHPLLHARFTRLCTARGLRMESEERCRIF